MARKKKLSECLEKSAYINYRIYDVLMAFSKRAEHLEKLIEQLKKDTKER